MEIESALIERVIAKDQDAQSRFSALYRENMLMIWEQRRPRSSSADLDGDFVHWFLIEWLARPADSWGNLRKFLQGNSGEKAPRFLAWWAATSRHRFSDFYREKIRSRFEQKMFCQGDRLEQLSEREPNDPERSMILEEALHALGECFDHFLERTDVRIESRLFSNLSLARPEASANELLASLHKLGFDVKEGELTARRGRVAAQVRGAATLIGRCLTSRGFTTDEVRSALPEFVEHLGGEA